MEKNGPVRVSYEAKSKNPIDVGTFVFTVSVKLYMEVCAKGGEWIQTKQPFVNEVVFKILALRKIYENTVDSTMSIFLYTGVCSSDVYREKYVIKSVQDILFIPFIPV